MSCNVNLGEPGFSTHVHDFRVGWFAYMYILCVFGCALFWLHVCFCLACRNFVV